MAGFLGAGKVLINPKDATTNAFKGWDGPYHASTFEPRTNAERKSLLSKDHESYGQAIGSVAIGGEPTFRMTLRDASKDALRLLFLGTEAAHTQANTAVTDEVVRAYPGQLIRVANRNISTTVLSSSPAGTNYVLGTDYTVSARNARLGFLEVVAGSSLATAISAAGSAGLELLVDYARAATTGWTIKAGTQASLRAWLLFDGRNLESQEYVECEIWEVVLIPDAGFDFLADDWNEIPLTGTMVTPTGRDDPFEVRALVAG
jgi:hypothetical protein